MGSDKHLIVVALDIRRIMVAITWSVVAVIATILVVANLGLLDWIFTMEMIGIVILFYVFTTYFLWWVEQKKQKKTLRAKEFLDNIQILNEEVCLPKEVVATRGTLIVSSYLSYRGERGYKSVFLIDFDAESEPKITKKVEVLPPKNFLFVTSGLVHRVEIPAWKLEDPSAKEGMFLIAMKPANLSEVRGRMSVAHEADYATLEYQIKDNQLKCVLRYVPDPNNKTTKLAKVELTTPETEDIKLELCGAKNTYETAECSIPLLPTLEKPVVVLIYLNKAKSNSQIQINYIVDRLRQIFGLSPRGILTTKTLELRLILKRGIMKQIVETRRIPLQLQT